MNIVVVLRLMPNLGDEPELDANGTDIDRDEVGMVINELDDQALEEAVLLKESTGATVTAVGLRTEGIEQVLRVAFARGADQVVMVDAADVDPYDSRTAASALAQAIRGLAPDLVLTGVQTPYDVFGQTAPFLAASLGWPLVSVVNGVTLGERTARVVQEQAAGRMTVFDVTLPAVLGIQAAASPPRYVSMSRLRQAMTAAPAESVKVEIDTRGAGSTMVSLAPPAHDGGVTMLQGDADSLAEQIAALLRERGVLT